MGGRDICDKYNLTEEDLESGISYFLCVNNWTSDEDVQDCESCEHNNTKNMGGSSLLERVIVLEKEVKELKEEKMK
jgi:hypothetical protein